MTPKSSLLNAWTINLQQFCILAGILLFVHFLLFYAQLYLLKLHYVINWHCIQYQPQELIYSTLIHETFCANIHTRIVGDQWRHKITICENGLSVYIHIWQICYVTNRQLFTRGYLTKSHYHVNVSVRIEISKICVTEILNQRPEFIFIFITDLQAKRLIPKKASYFLKNLMCH